MAKRAIRAFDYVNHPYEPVRNAVRNDAAGIFQRATQVAEERGDEIVASLSVDISGIKLSKDVAIKVGAITEKGAGFSRVTHVELEWEAKDSPGLFPVMKGEFEIFSLSPTETQVVLHGEYEPPMGLLGGALDAVVGHRLAEASLHRFVRAVVERLRHDVSG
jgi:ribosome-associated toxin RatA of RatAB toxin-antitoxin module